MNRKVREIRLEGNIAVVPLTRGYQAVIDAADVPLVDGWNWTAMVERRADQSVRTVYAARNERGADGKQRTVLMHRVIAKTPEGFETDHLDGSGLNNRRSNLRTATKSQNMQNKRASVTGSGHKGVSWHKGDQKWHARIMLNRRNHYLGAFPSLEAAKAAYAKASAERHGEFGRVA